MTKKMSLREMIQEQGFSDSEARWITSLYFSMYDILDNTRECTLMLAVLKDAVRWSRSAI